MLRRVLAPTVGLREPFDGIEFVVDAMTKQGPQHAGAGKPERLEVCEARPLSLWSCSHPDGEDSSLHDTPSRAENGVRAQAESERRPDLHLEALGLPPEDAERG